MKYESHMSTGQFAGFNILDLGYFNFVQTTSHLNKIGNLEDCFDRVIKSFDNFPKGTFST